MKIMKPVVLLYLLAAFVLCACSTLAQDRAFDTQSAVQLRSYQSRVFDTNDTHTTLRTVIAALQDLDFVVDKADATLGAVTATKLNNYEFRITVTVRPREKTQTIVRANAVRGNSPVTDPAAYQSFFNVLQKAMFLTAHQID